MKILLIFNTTIVVDHHNLRENSHLMEFSHVITLHYNFLGFLHLIIHSTVSKVSTKYIHINVTFFVILMQVLFLEVFRRASRDGCEVCVYDTSNFTSRTADWRERHYSYWGGRTTLKTRLRLHAARGTAVCQGFVLVTPSSHPSRSTLSDALRHFDQTFAKYFRNK